MSDNKKQNSFLAQIKALPDKERDTFWRGMVALSDAGRKAGVPAEDWASACAATYKELNKQLKEDAT